MINGRFERISLEAKNSIIDIPMGFFAISHNWIDDKKNRRKLYSKWFKISSNNRSVYRSLKFSANLKGSTKIGNGEISIDWGAWLILSDFSDEIPESLELKIRTANFFDIPRILIFHPNPSEKLAAQIALVSLILGIISLF